MYKSGSRPQETSFSQANLPFHKSKRPQYHSPINHHKKHVQNGHFNQNCTINSFSYQNTLKTSYNTYREKTYSYSDSQYDSKRPSYMFDMENSCNYHNILNVKQDKKPAALDKKNWISYASTASESDSSSSHSGSELSGFKIVHKGKVVHNEAEEEADLNNEECNFSVYESFKMEERPVKRKDSGNFASSVLVAGPNVKEISIPNFA